MSNASLYLSRAARTSLLAPDSAPSLPPQHTYTPAPSSAARSRLRMTLARANRRTSRSLAVNAPSLNMGCENRLVVAVVTTRPVSASARVKSAIRASRSPGLASKSNTSLSWKLTPWAPSSASLRTARSARIGGRTAGPNTSTPCQPTVQMPNENLSAGVGAYASVVTARRSFLLNDGPGWPGPGRSCGQESMVAGSPPSQPVVASRSAAKRSLMPGWAVPS